MSLELFSLQQFTRYRRLAEATDQCGPFVPVVGERYGDRTLPKFAYCGAAARWEDYDAAYPDDGVAYEMSKQTWREFFSKRLRSSPFWCLFDEILEQLDKSGQLSIEERRRCAVWTNISKLGSLRQTAPSDRRELRKLDSKQLQHEINILKPDILLCVSGSSLIRTGEDVFHKLESANFETAVPQSEVRRLPDGGFLYWTMHPGGRGKGKNWRDAVVGDVNHLLESGAA